LGSAGLDDFTAGVLFRDCFKQNPWVLFDPCMEHIISHRIHGTGIFTYIWLIFMVNVGIYTIHGSYEYICALFAFHLTNAGEYAIHFDPKMSLDKSTKTVLQLPEASRSFDKSQEDLRKHCGRGLWQRQLPGLKR